MKSEEEIEKLADERYLKKTEGINDFSLKGYIISATKGGFVEGYTQCQGDMADKKYTFNQITDAIAMAREIDGKEAYHRYSMEQILLSLNKQD